MLSVAKIYSLADETPPALHDLESTNGEIAQGAWAWANFNTNGGSVTSSFNVDSISNIATGTVGITFATAMPNANYGVGQANDPQTSPSNGRYHMFTQSYSVTGFQVVFVSDGVTPSYSDASTVAGIVVVCNP